MSSKIGSKQVKDFQNTVLEFFNTRGRVFPWRETSDPYKILVSEMMMLQQTQVARVVPKYEAFLLKFPAVKDLAAASLTDALALWIGLGYNRRARYLHQTAQKVVSEHGGVFPITSKELQNLPGIGPYTASAVMTFAYNAREVLIETNVRTVFIHHFFKAQEEITDLDILELIEATLPIFKKTNEQALTARQGLAVNKSYREWYWALMDYGSYLKEALPNPSRRSKHHTKQSKFKGSLREARGLIVRILSAGSNSEARLRCLAKEEGIENKRLLKALKGLEKENFIESKCGAWEIV